MISKVTVCGLETLTLSDSTPVEYRLTRGTSGNDYHEVTFAAWFLVDYSAFDTSTYPRAVECTIKEF